jgi:hypothetical protein
MRDAVLTEDDPDGILEGVEVNEMALDASVTPGVGEVVRMVNIGGMSVARVVLASFDNTRVRNGIGIPISIVSRASVVITWYCELGSSREYDRAGTLRCATLDDCLGNDCSCQEREQESLCRPHSRRRKMAGNVGVRGRR